MSKKYKLNTEIMGRAVGTVVTIHTEGARNHIVTDPRGNQISVPVGVLDEIPEGLTAEGGLSSAPEFKYPDGPYEDRIEVEETEEKLARVLYDAYSEETGGHAWNGAPLPPASEFFEDERTQKQANAWRKIAVNYVDLGVLAGVFVPPQEDEEESTPTSPEEPVTNTADETKDSGESGQEETSGSTGEAAPDSGGELEDGDPIGVGDADL